MGGVIKHTILPNNKAALKNDGSIALEKREPKRKFRDRLTPVNVKFAVLIAAITLIIIGGVLILPYFKDMLSEQGRDALTASIRAEGLSGLLMFIALQILQVVLFIIPGEVIEVVGGMLYGTWWGYFACAAGSLAGSAIIYRLVMWLGYDFVNELAQNKLGKLKFLQKTHNVELIVFILFLIPGTPKDALTYFIPFTKLSLARFLIVSTIARIPSVVSSTFAGASLQNGDVAVSVLTFILIAVFALAGILINHRYIKKQNEET